MKQLKLIILSLLCCIGAKAQPTPPLFSTDGDDHWYYIVFSAGEAVLEDQGDKNSAFTRIPKTGKETQLWKFTGSQDGFTIMSKAGRYLRFNEYIRSTTDAGEAASFRLLPSENPSYTDSWEIQYPDKGDAWDRWNQWGNTGPGVRIGLYTPGESNNAIRFIAEEDLPKCPEYVKINEFKTVPDAAFLPEGRHTIWFTKPATAESVSDPWMEYGLPIGAGDFGAMTFGGIAQDRIQFNDKSLWTGTSTSRGCYQNFGDLYIEDISGAFGNSDETAAKEYSRRLDMENAISTARYLSPDGKTEYTREYIASHPDRCVAIRLAASEQGRISVRLRLFNGIKQGMLAPAYTADGTISFQGKLDLVDFKAMVKAVPTGGQMTATDEYLEVTDADELLVILCGATNFDPHSPSYTSDRDAMLANVDACAENAASKGWERLLADHTADFSAYFGRVDFQIDAALNDRTTQDIITNYNGRRANRTDPCNLMLEELYYAFGRYLLISSSRGMDSPANLQGIWNHSSTPAWQSDIHSNINVQMNYWPAEVTNLSEMHMPFLNYLHSMVTEHGEWGEYARRSGQSKGWTCFTQNNIFGHSDYAENYVIANAWYCTHLWKHYAYTLDREFLREKALPVMLSCVDFWMERLILDEDGTWVAPKEWSPEHGPAEEDGTAHAQQIVHELFTNALAAISALGDEAGVSDEYVSALETKLAALDPGLAIEEYTGPSKDWLEAGDPLLREWKHSPYTVGENEHRHQSHLMAMYPFGDITPESEWFRPAVNSLRLRGDQSTGWSLAWRIALWGRALDGSHAHTIIKNALRHASSYAQSNGAGGIYYNLLDSHAPFQIDGNFGYTAGVTEMLLQSHGGVIRLLPALPEYWAAGHINGLKAEGNIEVDQTWDNGVLTEATLRPAFDTECKVNCKGISKAVVTDSDGNQVNVSAEGTDMVSFKATGGTEYTLTMPDPSYAESIEEAMPAIIVRDGIASVNGKATGIAAYDIAGRCLRSTSTSELDLRGLNNGTLIIKATLPSGKIMTAKAMRL